jgi:hypothetical protein
MSSLGDQFSRFAIAERELSEQAGPVLATIIERLQIRLGVRISEIHVTVDQDSHASLNATCTIADADTACVGPAKGDGETKATQSVVGVQPPFE